ncbi:MAG: glycosyltransferase family 4 protein [Alphaproteobacteria bacterium]|nr:glycosyltransferase family 4 protein [Alphaproteobacteria bacterium]
MINLHVFPDFLVHASRVRRMTATAADTGLYTHVVIAGRTGHGLPEAERLDTCRSIVRLPGPRHRQFLLRSAEFFAWNYAVVRQFWDSRIAMINCHSLSALPACVALKRRHKAPLIYEPHELESATSRMGSTASATVRHFERLMLRDVDHVILVSDSIRDWYRVNQKVQSCSTVPNCPPLTEARQSDYLRQTFGIAEERAIFLYHGILNRGRGIERLLEAFHQDGMNAELVLLGYGPLSPEGLRSDRNVHWHPGAPPDCLLNIAASADFGVSMIEPVSLSYEYCLPTKLFDYIMARRPVMVSDTVEQAKLVREFNIGLVVNHKSTEAIRSAVEQLVVRGRSGYEAGLEEARTRFCWERFETRIRDLHSRLLGDRRDPSD